MVEQLPVHHDGAVRYVQPRQTPFGQRAAHDVLRQKGKPHALLHHLAQQRGAAQFQMVERGMGLSFLPEYIVRAALAAGTLARLNVPDCRVEMHRQLFYHRDKWLTPQMKGFIALVREGTAQPAAPTQA